MCIDINKQHVLYFQAPSPPRNVIVSELTFSSLKVTWVGPQNPNGDLKFYKVSHCFSMYFVVTLLFSLCSGLLQNQLIRREFCCI